MASIDTIDQVCRVALRVQTISLVDATFEINYPQIRPTLTARAIAKRLKAEPSYFDDWFGYLVDQRCTPGMWIQKTWLGCAAQRVDSNGPSTLGRFLSRESACALVILSLLDDVVGHFPDGPPRDKLRRRRRERRNERGR